MSNVLKLVPAEVVAPFMIGSQKILSKEQPAGLTIWFVICLLACLAIRAAASYPPHGAGPWYKEVRWRLVLVSAIAFVIWAHAVVAQPPALPWLDQFWAS